MYVFLCRFLLVKAFCRSVVRTLGDIDEKHYKTLYKFISALLSMFKAILAFLGKRIHNISVCRLVLKLFIFGFNIPILREMFLLDGMLII